MITDSNCDISPTLRLFGILYRMGIIVSFYNRRHKFYNNKSLLRQPHGMPKKIPENWMPLSAVSLSVEFVEVIPVTKRSSR